MVKSESWEHGARERKLLVVVGGTRIEMGVEKECGGTGF